MTCLVSTLTQWPYHARTCGVTETLEFWRSRMKLSMIIGAPVRSTTKLPLSPQGRAQETAAAAAAADNDEDG